VLETVRARLVRRMISTDVFEVVGVCPVQCIGVAARIAAPLLQRSVEMASTVSRSRATGTDHGIIALSWACADRRPLDGPEPV
jgi:hypothetical protein